MGREVFISYRKEDKASADRICGALERDNIKCWIAPRDVPVGREWAASIVHALKACSSFIVVLSSNSKNAKQISREAELADNVGLPIITVRIEDVEPPPELQYFLGNIQWLDAFGPNFDLAMGRLADVVRQRAAAPAATADIDGPERTEKSARDRDISAAASVVPESSLQPPQRSQASTFSSSSALPPPMSASPLPRRSLSPYLMIGALVLVVVLGLGIWWARRPPPPAPTNHDSDAAAAFGIEYMQQRDSGQPRLAYAMTGPAFQRRWTFEKFTANVEALRSRGKVTGYALASPCTERERGAYTCDYLASYADGKKKKESFTLAKRAEGWAIAGDGTLNSQ